MRVLEAGLSSSPGLAPALLTCRRNGVCERQRLCLSAFFFLRFGRGGSYSATTRFDQFGNGQVTI